MREPESAMGLPFDTLTIHRLRGLQDVELAGLGRVNLLVGGNDSGKTSVLEALSLYCNPLDPMQWVHVALGRDPLMSPSDPLPVSEVTRWLFPQRPAPGTHESGEARIRLTATGRSAVRGVQASYLGLTGLPSRRMEPRRIIRMGSGAGEQELEPTRERHGARLEGLIETEEAQPMRFTFSVWDDGQVEPLGGAVAARLRVPVRLVSPPDHWLGSLTVRSFSELRLSGLEESVRVLLKAIDPRIDGLEVLAPSGEAVLYVRDAAAGLIPLSMFGDGIRRTLLLALVLPQVKGGVLLIDELETAIHVSALGKVFRWMLEACKQHDVQLFATTHSLEVVDAILGADDTREEDIVGFRLERGEGRTSARRFGEDLLKRMRYERGLDVR
ncbi:AAA family ATPase [Archangium violaceum]|uniref:AAA family ATPase n=1 Tax=Archangium violaceum TaxID=83451 RepID=UPI00193C3A53|nr:ATP-binding protein [Archangium violaceum]QRK11239.1 AAA family ATPase [Archangium violaceum]